MADAEPGVLTVSQITSMIRGALESGFPAVTVEGEVSNFRPSATGHFYFSLKDADAVLSAVMFKSRSRGLQFQPADGMLVRARGAISVYERRGNYQLICESLSQSGQGNLLLLLEERKQRLAREGLFAAERKRPLPLLPRRVAVVTSPTGAAIRDIIHVLGRRSAGVDLIVLPAPVQGEGAAERIAAQIQVANRYRLADVLIVGRGGGSLEDLLPFYEEVTVRAVAASEIPVISAVGHEVDVALCDLAADVRAPTPSAAAELVSASRDELLRRVHDRRAAMEHTVRQRLEHVRTLLGQFAEDSLRRSFEQLLQPRLQRFDDARVALAEAARRRLRDLRHALQLAVQDLRGASPLAILARGYAVVTLCENGEVVRQAGQAGVGEQIDIRLHEGRLGAEVKETDV